MMSYYVCTKRKYPCPGFQLVIELRITVMPHVPFTYSSIWVGALSKDTYLCPHQEMNGNIRIKT